jgi:hypothetical protein
MSYTTQFGSLDRFRKGSIEIIEGSAKHYVFSNMFEVANGAKPYEKVVVAKNLQFVIETLRAEGDSPWFAASHDEFVVAMDGEVEVQFVKLDDPDRIVPASKEGSVKLQGEPQGKKMGYVRLKRGHQALLPAHAAYRFRALRRGVLLLQTILGEHSVQKWAEICFH